MRIRGPVAFWWVRFWGIAGPDDGHRAYREAHGSRPGVAGPFWTQADAEGYAATLSAKTDLVKTPPKPGTRPDKRTE